MNESPSRAKLLRFIDELILRNDAGRQRLAAALHDDVLGALAAAKMEASFSTEGRQRSSPDLLDAAIGRVRELEQDLRPHYGSLGLRAAIEWQLRRFRLVSGLECTTGFDGDYEEIAESACTDILAVLRAALENVVAHAQATSVHVSGTRVRGNLCILIRDNGCGLGRKASPVGLGLLEMRMRAHRLRARLSVGSAPSGSARTGTTVKLLIPLPTP